MMRNSKKFIVFFLSLAIGFSIISGCSKEASTPGVTTSEESIKLVESIILDTFNKDTVLGNLATNGFELNVPKDAFKDGTKLTVSGIKNDVSYKKDAMTPTSSTLDFIIEGDERRSSLPMLLKVSVDKSYFQNLKEYEGFKGVHYSEETGWTYTDPIEVNKEEGYIAFNIYNNPLWGAAELTENERKEEFIKGKALESWGSSQIKGDVQDITRQMVESILVDKFNASNPSEIGLIANEVLKELKYGTLEFGKLADNLMTGDFESYTANVATMIGTTIANSAEEDTLSEVFGQTGTAIAMAGHIWEGDFSGAGMKLAEAISETSPAYRVAKVAIAAIDMKIGNWKSNGIEEAYKAYKEGSNDYILYGYDNDPGDFEQVWDQMRGVARQIEMDAVKRYASALGVSESELTQEQIDRERTKVKDTLREQFGKRKEQEEEILKHEENQRELVKQFEEWNLLKKGSTWYPEDSSIEQMLTRLHNQVKRIQQETGRFDIVYKDGDLHNQNRGLDNIGKVTKKEMLASDLAKLINTRYVYGEEEYQKLLKQMGYAPEIKLELGTYFGSLTITDAPALELAEAALNDPSIVPETIVDENGDACEYQIDLTEQDIQNQLRDGIEKVKNVIGKPIPLTIVITQGASENEFKANVKADYATAFPDYGCEDMSLPENFTVVYNEGSITLIKIQEEEMVEENYSGKLTMDGKMEGSYTMSSSQPQYNEKSGSKLLIQGTWKANR